MQILTALHGTGAAAVIAGLTVPAVAALAIRLLWRPRTTPWDA